jgi:hypothetical protein
MELRLAATHTMAAGPSTTIRYHRTPARHLRTAPSNLRTPLLPSKKAFSVIAASAGPKRPIGKSARESPSEEALTRAAGIQRPHEIVNASAKKVATWFLVADMAYLSSFPDRRGAV